MVKGTTVGTATDIDGNFTLSVPNDAATLVVSYMGYKTVELPVGNQTRFDVILDPDAIALGDVVVTALGIQREAKTLTYSAQQVDGAEMMKAKDINFMNALSGKTAGLEIKRSASGAGGSTRTVLRGAKSFSGNSSPLYVVDGVPIVNSLGSQTGLWGGTDEGDGISQLNPDDIESISVLKGANAAILYGSQVANGVVMITTKKGREGVVDISIGNATTFENVLVWPELQYKYGSVGGAKESWATTPLDSYDDKFVKDFFQLGHNIVSNVSISGGSSRTTAFLSYANTAARGIIPENSYLKHKTIMKKIIGIIILVVLVAACTDRFESVNKNPYRVADESLAQDYNFGVRFAILFQNLTTDQTGENLATDDYVRHTGCPTDFLGNRNNTTYYIDDGWNANMWNRVYNNVMSPSRVIKSVALDQGFTLYAAWADLFQVSALSRLTVYHGPLIYSDYGIEDKPMYKYDSEKELYNRFFAELDTIYKEFKTNLPDPSKTNLQKIDAKFDPTYDGDLAKWLKYINSLRLRLAMRIVKVDPSLAREQGQKAIDDPAGLILTTADNFKTSLYGSRHNIWTMCHSWNDTRMGAGMEEFLCGYNDPRLYRWFEPAVDSVVTNPDMPYKGIASGSYIVAKDHRLGFSKMANAYFSQTGNGGKHRRFLTAAEVNFILAEAVLRGWNVGNVGGRSAKEYYETGVRESFVEWEVTGADEYLADDTSKPLEKYIDPVDNRNNYISRSTITIKWDDTAEPEVKLERIITQKWIDAFLNANEVWSDHRRTGYPKLHYVPKNDSNGQWGVIANDDFLKRMPFVQNERLNNPEGVAEATSKLGGLDLINTRLWIHPEGPNF